MGRTPRPRLLGLATAEIDRLNDDCVGRALDRLFLADVPSLVLAVATHAVKEFGVSLDELHNDSTTVSFCGAYTEAATEQRFLGRPTLAITFGHNKDHRPDLKQLLFILTVTADGGVPLHFRAESGNVVDDQTHRDTWDLLCQLTGRRDFLYVADCKLATSENMAYLHQRQGRFVTVLPRTRGEDAAFRALVAKGQVAWRPLWEKTDDEGEVIDRYSTSDQPATTAEGYRLVWYHSLRKAESDAVARSGRIEKALKQLAALREKLRSPRTRYRQEAKVAAAVAEILESCGAEAWIVTEVQPQTQETFHQDHRGRPGKDTHYVKKVATRFDLAYRIDDRPRRRGRPSDGIFPAGDQCCRPFASWNCSTPTSGSRRSRSGSRSSRPTSRWRRCTSRRSIASRRCCASTSSRCWWRPSWSVSCVRRCSKTRSRHCPCIPRGVPAGGRRRDG